MVRTLWLLRRVLRTPLATLSRVSYSFHALYGLAIQSWPSRDGGKMRFRLALLAALLGASLGAALGQSKSTLQTSPGEAPDRRKQQTLSTRVVAYQIDARLDTTRHTISATETLRYRNLTGQPQQTFPFHLYLNAFQPQSTFMTEYRRDNPDFDWKPERYGAIRIVHLEVTGAGDLTDRMKFIHADDDNADDRTVMQIELPKAVPPGA